MRSATENAAPPSFSPCPKPCCFDTFQPLTPEQVLILINSKKSESTFGILSKFGLFFAFIPTR